MIDFSGLTIPLAKLEMYETVSGSDTGVVTGASGSSSSALELGDQVAGPGLVTSGTGTVTRISSNAIQLNPTFQQIVQPGMWYATSANLLTLTGGSGGISFNNHLNSAAIASFTDSGNVGVGNSSPNNTLDVNGGIRAQGLISAAQSGSGLELGTDNSGNVVLQGYNRGTSLYMPTYLRGSNLTAVAADGNLTLETDGGNVQLQGGNVGVGASSPAYKLDVTGDVNASGKYRVNGGQIAASNLSNGTTGSGSVVLASSPTLSSPTETGTSTVSQLNASTIYLSTLGSPTSTAACYNLSGGWYQLSACSSTRESKEHIRPLAPSLDKVLRLRPVSFNFKGSARAEAHFVAEDVEKLDARCSTYDAQGKLLGVNDGCLLAIAVKAIQEQEKKIEQQQAQIDSLKREVDALKRYHQGGYAARLEPSR